MVFSCDRKRFTIRRTVAVERRCMRVLRRAISMGARQGGLRRRAIPNGEENLASGMP
jgi:hypothetical protein